MKAICCSNQGSLSLRDAIIDDLTHKEILRPDAPTVTVGYISADWFIATIVIVVWDAEDVEITIVDQIEVWRQRSLPQLQ
jgi:hypothetical protein